MVAVIHAIKRGKTVYAIFAPAIEGHFGTANVGMLKSALKKLGFSESVEVSLGADAVARHEAQELKMCIRDSKYRLCCFYAFCM